MRKLVIYIVGMVMVLTAKAHTVSGERKNAADLPVIDVPIGGNTFYLPGRTANGQTVSGGEISEKGIINWTSPAAGFKTYVRFSKKGTIKVWLKLRVPSGKSQLVVHALGKTIRINAEGNLVKAYYVGEFSVTAIGYVDFEITGVAKTDKIFAELSSIQLSGEAVSGTNFVRNNEGDYFYWGRRGPSVHLGYQLPDNMNAEWFYNEVKVPVTMDVIGSYFMADGFGEGYFGMQVNSASERRVLFSVWSPFTTDDPTKIPEDQKIKLLSKGEKVHTGEFGNEGSGGQSYLQYNWKAGLTYKFLLRGQPDGGNHTKYTAWFYDEGKRIWLLIASFSRPGKSTYLKHLHSFLENFEPETGSIGRRVEFTNQWIRTSDGRWIELNKATFTGDNTARKGYRMDYAGGINNSSFYLRNCGFFNQYTGLDQVFERPFSGKQPVIDLAHLPQ